MDFASLMSTAIKSSASPASPPTNKSSTTTQSPPPTAPSKFLKRSDLEAQRKAAYLKEQQETAAARSAKLAQKRKLDEEEATRSAAREEKKRRLAEESRLRREEEESRKERARRKRLGLPDLPTSDTPNSEEPPSTTQEDIPPSDLLQRLRALSEPAILFGETHPQRLRRYHALTAPPSTAPALSTGPIPTTLALLPASSILLPSATLPPITDTRARQYLFRQLASYFSLLLSTWSSALAARPADLASSTTGRAASLAMQQSLTNMRPLFRRFETASTSTTPPNNNNNTTTTSDLPDSILAPIVEIVHAAQQRRYVDANDGYLRLSIGKAAWPIGVTMVGIHERSAREKLHEGEGEGGAHIMSDEVTRKFLQSIKRCLTFAQTRWPPEDLGQLMG
ncbi:MAG: mRNA splicing protein prp18 [Heterodermia speciosa]|uniref:Pre-mRNA-splicing factor 18 n=1 Tax=Heterodermia speciosa TaxID=116794 RepID=A0A8H3IUQ0_9LECA|nr:MAG: mRNA splicing protein prp18 [Heterodermia speciosa]